MAGINLSTESVVKVYPSARRGVYSAYSRLLSEEAMTRLVNTLIDKTGFVIGINSGNIRFNIKGYYFEVNYSDLVDSFPTATQIYAEIKIVKYGDFWELDGQDVANEYTGVKFYDSEPTTSSSDSNTQYYHILLLDKTGGTWVIPTSSQEKFDLSNQISEIDGGIIQ